MSKSDFFWDHSTLIVICSLASVAIPLGIVVVHDDIVFNQNKEASLESDINGLSCPWLQKIYDEDKDLWLNPNQQLDEKVKERMVELKC